MEEGEDRSGKGFPEGEQGPPFIAHKCEDGMREEPILEHLEKVAGLLTQFSEAFLSKEYAHALGLIHDIGKYSREFQRRIRENGPKVDHSTAGARELYRMGMTAAAYCAAGHHGGLPAGGSAGDLPDEPTLLGRLKRQIPNYSAFGKELVVSPVSEKAFERHFDEMFLIRMMFSALTDADFLATEDFMSGGQAGRTGYDGISDLSESFERYVREKKWDKPQTDLNRMRRDIMESCRKAAMGEPGLYSLTVPTGGGKTAASLAFALCHGRKYQKKRIIYVIPYTSIIEQTAAIFREMLGAENVLEHHSSVSFDGGDDGFDERLRLSAENWDAPVIVTTSVQFFESLFAHKPSRCRKLHNIAESVIVFDEVQMLPLSYLRPCVEAIGVLVRDYGATAVLCTATQPSLERFFREGLAPQEICPNVEELYRFFRRTKLENIGKQSLSAIAGQMSGMDGALTIVNKKQSAYELYQMLPQEGRFHLSANMCPAHRREMLTEIRRRLQEKLPCRVVATSLIEAGVDVDFPAVFREAAGLASILQAAGRCNREGKNPWEESIVALFSLEGKIPDEIHRAVTVYQDTAELFEDVSTPEAIQFYFDALHQLETDRLGREKGLDEKEILPIIEKGLDGSQMPFPEVSRRFRLIDEASCSVLIPWDDKAKAIRGELLEGKISRERLREAGPYLVSVRPGTFADLESSGDIWKVGEDLAVLAAAEVGGPLSAYDQETGLHFKGESGKAIFID